MTKERKAYEDRLHAQLAEWNAQIALLKARADKAKAETKIEYYKTIEALEQRQEVAKTKLQELKLAGDDAWKEVKTGVEKVWEEVKAAFHSAASHFK